MKKIKSKLVYVNPALKNLQRPQKSPSPDTKNRSKIQKTNSPAKQVETYYKIKNNAIVYHCTTHDQKNNKKYTQNLNRSHSKQVSSFSLNNNDSHEQIDLKNISENIKLKSPSTVYYSNSNQRHFKQPSFVTNNSFDQFHTPKAKSTLFKQDFYQFPNQQTKNYLSENKVDSFDQQGGFAFQVEYHSQVKDKNIERKGISPNKKSKKKLQIYSTLMNSSKQKPTKDSPLKFNQITSPQNKLNTQKQFIKHHFISSQQPKYDKKDAFISQLQKKLSQKDKQIQKMSMYMNQYEKLGAKNKKLEKDMQQILGKLIQMKSKQQQSLNKSRQNESHNQFNQDQQSSSKSQHSISKSLSLNSYEQQSSSEIQRQNAHNKPFHKNTLTDEYIKIYDDLQSSNFLPVDQQEQSYKPNFMKYTEIKKQANPNVPQSHRKILSVGARLKESLNAKNEDFKAEFDASILMSSSSSQKFSNNISSPDKRQQKNYDFTKKQHLKTKQTEEQSVSLQDLETYHDNDSFSSIENINSQSKDQKQQNSKLRTIDQFYGDSSKSLEEQTTVKKQKLKYSVKKKNQQQLFSERNTETLVQTNRKLTSIIQNLMKSHDSMFQQVKRMSEKNQTYVNKMTQIQEDFNQIKSNFTQLTLFSQQIFNSMKHNFGDQFSFKNTLMKIQQKVNKLYESINENTKEIKRQNSRKQVWLQNNQISLTNPFLSKVNSFGKQPETEKQCKKSRKQSGSELKQPVSPSFTYLEESASFLTDSFKLSHSDRSNPSNSRYNYCSNVQDQINSKSLKQSQRKLPKYEESKILIMEESRNNESESNLLSNGTSQFIQIQSGRGVSEKSGTSKDKIMSENSEIRINFDDVDDEDTKCKGNLEIIERNLNIIEREQMKKSEGSNVIQESVLLMKSSFGPIIQKEMSRSEKGDSAEGQNQDEVHNVEFGNESPHRPQNRPRQNSSINIFFSSDSICKTNKLPSLMPHDFPHYRTTQNNSSQQSSFKSGKCYECYNKDEKIKYLEAQCKNMKQIITELNQEKDNLQKMIKSKISIIDGLEVSLKELQSLSSLEHIKSKKQLFEVKSSQNQQNFEQNPLDNQQSQKNPISWYKNTNNIQNIKLRKNEEKSSIFSIKPMKFEQIQDLLPISRYLQNDVPFDKIQTLKSIEIQIKKELLKEQQIERQLHEKYMNQRGNTLDWARGSFSKVDEFREQSFLKTKAILIKLIGLIRQFISEGTHNKTNK